VKEGDRIIYGKFGGTEVDADGESVLILRADDIYAIYA
ncbi:MAG: co-chaperone GroES, partial [Clostridia bacterium]